jgi:hypothetical protein
LRHVCGTICSSAVRTQRKTWASRSATSRCPLHSPAPVRSRPHQARRSQPLSCFQEGSSRGQRHRRGARQGGLAHSHAPLESAPRALCRHLTGQPSPSGATAMRRSPWSATRPCQRPIQALTVPSRKYAGASPMLSPMLATASEPPPRRSPLRPTRTACSGLHLTSGRLVWRRSLDRPGAVWGMSSHRSAGRGLARDPVPGGDRHLPRPSRSRSTAAALASLPTTVRNLLLVTVHHISNGLDFNAQLGGQ